MVAVHDTILVRPVSALDFQNACCRGSSTFWFRSIVYPLVLSFRPRLVESGKLWWAMYSVFIGILDIQCHYRKATDIDRKSLGPPVAMSLQHIHGHEHHDRLIHAGGSTIVQYSQEKATRVPSLLC